MHLPNILLFFWLPIVYVYASKTHEFVWTITKTIQNPDGNNKRPVITINDSWPAPLVRIQKGDRLKITVINQLDEPTSIHFHGIFQKGSTFMDGASMISQCPIAPSSQFVYDFTVEGQSGTYWYHSHSSAQYGDGLRGVLVVEDPQVKEELGYDDDLAISLSDWYYGESKDLVDDLFISGSEPSINSALFNESHDVNIDVEPGKVYYLRLVNVGMSASQYFYIAGHQLTIVEADGVRVEPVDVDSLNIGTGQRYGVLLKTKDTKEKNYPIVQVTNMMMHKKYSINWLAYNTDITNPSSSSSEEGVQTKKVDELNPIDDLELVPVSSKHKLLPPPTHKLHLTYQSNLYSDDKYYYAFNSQPFIAPRIPTLNTLNSALNTPLQVTPQTYGLNTNAVIIDKDDIIELIIDSNDHMRHPFHLHGHNFQVLSRGSHSDYFSSPASSPDYELKERPLVRDTVMVPGRGFVQLRFKADNPGVWFFHCHTEWHAVQGLGLVFIEDPLNLFNESFRLPLQNEMVCKDSQLGYFGNAVGNADLADLTGELKVYLETELWYDSYVDFNDSKSQADSDATLAGTGNTESTTTPATPAMSADPSNSHGDKDMNMPDSIPVAVKSKVLVIYFLIMISIAIVIALVLNYYTKKRRRGADAEYQRVESIDLHKELDHF